MARITEQQIEQAWRMLCEGNTLTNIAELLNVSRSGITDRLKDTYGFVEFEAAKQGKFKLDDEEPEEDYSPELEEPEDPVIEYTLTKNKLVISWEDQIHTFNQNDHLFNPLRLHCLNEEWEAVINLLDKQKVIKEKSDNRIQIDGMTLSVDGVEFPLQYTKLILEEMNKDLHKPFDNIMAFFGRCIKANISETIVQQMFEFLKHNDIQILSDGSIQGWKYVQKGDKDYYDTYTGTILNNEGLTVSMPREEVVADPSVTCSHGLHVGAWDYVNNQTYIAKVILLPEDVVSVPIDYSGMKLRCCRYYVHEILEDPLAPSNYTKPLPEGILD